MKTTVKVTHKKGKTIVSNDDGTKWEFDSVMRDETIIASLVFQTIYVRFRALGEFYDDYTIDFSMEETINKKDKP